MKVGGKINMSIRLPFIVTFFLISNFLEVSACSRLQRATEENFKDLAAVFRGTAISAEIIQPEFSTDEEAKEYDGLFFVKVRWKIEEVFKGENLDEKAAVTSSFCGAGPIVVGAAYIFAIVNLPEDKLYSSMGNDVIGYIAEAKGGFSFQVEMEEFEKLNLELRLLGKKK